jgi:rare lipoprotein A
MTEFRLQRTASSLLALLLLAACASSPAPQSTTPPRSASDAYQASRYGIQQDRGPSDTFDPSQVREVVTVIPPRTTAGNRSPYTVNGRTYQIMPSEEGYRERGFASWYGEKFHGHDTSNGEVYDMFQLSAAHKSMPIPGFLRVTNLENNKSIIVRVNDRGPFHNDRIIDLSYAAAHMLDFANKGTAMVEVEAIMPTIVSNSAPSTARTIATTASSTAAGGQYLQVGAFSDLRAAEQLSARLRNLTSRPVFIRSVETAGSQQTMHRVRVGPIPDSDELARITDSVVAADLGSPYTVRE